MSFENEINNLLHELVKEIHGLREDLQTYRKQDKEESIRKEWDLS